MPSGESAARTCGGSTVSLAVFGFGRSIAMTVSLTAIGWEAPLEPAPRAVDPPSPSPGAAARRRRLAGPWGAGSASPPPGWSRRARPGRACTCRRARRCARRCGPASAWTESACRCAGSSGAERRSAGSDRPSRPSALPARAALRRGRCSSIPPGSSPACPPSAPLPSHHPPRPPAGRWPRPAAKGTRPPDPMISPQGQHREVQGEKRVVMARFSRRFPRGPGDFHAPGCRAPKGVPKGGPKGPSKWAPRSPFGLPSTGRPSDAIGPGGATARPPGRFLRCPDRGGRGGEAACRRPPCPWSTWVW
ncbi:hypothetical protein SUDANB180_00033 [Streptomyces sp. enrichment culture]